MQDTPAHGGEHRQHRFKCRARAAGENGDIAGFRAVASARHRAFHEQGAARLHQDAQTDHLGVIGGAHFQPDLPRAHRRQKAIGALCHGAAGGGRGQAGDDDIHRVAQRAWAVRRLRPARDKACHQRRIQIADGHFVAIADQTAGQFAADIAEADKSDFHDAYLADCVAT